MRERGGKGVLRPGGDFREDLRRRGLAPNKRLGQNFLRDEGILERIVEAAEIASADTVLEIGPGAGALTERLAGRAGRLVAVEIDRGLAAALTERYAGNPRVEIVCGDILKTRLETLFAGEISSGGGRGTVKVVANLPYYITTPILLSLLPREELFSRFVVMLQREVADRMRAVPGSRDYGALSLAVRYYAVPRLVTEVPPGAFYPRPGVMSAVLCLDRYERKPVEVEDPERMFALIRAAFGKRRKTMANAVAGAPALGISAERLRAVLEELGLDPEVRGEKLSLAQFAAVSDRLLDHEEGLT